MNEGSHRTADTTGDLAVAEPRADDAVDAAGPAVVPSALALSNRKVDGMPSASVLTGERRTAREVAPERSVSLRRVAATFVRAGAFATILLALLFARTAVSPYAVVLALGVAVVALFALGRTRTGYGYYVAYISGLTLFTLLRNIADDTGIRFKGQYTVDVERWLFGGTLPTTWLQDRLFDAGKVGVIAVVCAAVYVSYFFATHIVALVFWRRNPAEFKRYALAVLLTGYAGLAIMFLVPTAPPWLASEHSNAPRMTRVLGDAFGWNPEQAGHGMAGGNPFAAMPSLHSAVTVLIVLAIWRWRKLRAPAVVYLVAMWFTLVYCGEHYVIDLLVGAAVAVTAWLVATRLVGSPAPLQPVDLPDLVADVRFAAAEDDRRMLRTVDLPRQRVVQHPGDGS